MFLNKKIGKYIIQEKIGEGNFAKVHKAVNENNKNEIFAVKILKNSLFNNNPMLEKLLNHEVEIMNTINHVNIMHLFEHFESKNNRYLIINYCNKGDLESYLNSIDIKYINEDIVLEIMKQIRNGFLKLRKNKILHRDFKLSNIFIHDENIIIGDFGISKLGFEMSSTKLGTPLFMAPELMEANPKQSSKTDLWSIGVVFYQLLFNKPPFFGLSLEEIRISILDNGGENLKIPINKNLISEDLQILLKKLLEPNPNDRIEWVDFFNYPLFFKTNNSHLLKNFFNKDYQLKIMKNKKIEESTDFIDLNVKITESNDIISNQNSHIEIKESNNLIKQFKNTGNSNYNSISDLIKNSDYEVKKVNKDIINSSQDRDNYKNLFNCNKKKSTIKLENFSSKSNISFYEVISKMTLEEICFENNYRISHEKNKIIFLLRNSMKILNCNKNFINLYEEFFEIIKLSIKKAYYLSHFFYVSLKNKNNFLNFINFDYFKNHNFYFRQLKDFEDLLEEIKEFWDYSVSLKTKFFQENMEDENNENNEKLLTFEDINIDDLNQLLIYELRQISKEFGNENYKLYDKEILILFINSNYSIYLEKYFQYWNDIKKYNWNILDNNFKLIDNLMLFEFIDCLIEDILK